MNCTHPKHLSHLCNSWHNFLSRRHTLYCIHTIIYYWFTDTQALTALVFVALGALGVSGHVYTTNEIHSSLIFYSCHGYGECLQENHFITNTNLCLALAQVDSSKICILQTDRKKTMSSLNMMILLHTYTSLPTLAQHQSLAWCKMSHKTCDHMRHETCHHEA